MPSRPTCTARPVRRRARSGRDAPAPFCLSAGPHGWTLGGRRCPMSDDDARDEPRPRPALATMLATEHWSLLGTRSMTWSEIMSRISIMLTVMSAFLVALALVARGDGFDRSVLPLATGFACASLVIGSLTA